jgi:DNA-3-methyladenine glycosylase I
MARREVERCDWCVRGNEAYVAYHDDEWGVPVRDDAKHFEFLVLESAQAGLSWSTVLNKREGYRRAFADFDPERVARFTDKRVEKLTQDAGIIRNRQKIAATIGNARVFLEIQAEFGSFDAFFWQFVDGRPVQNRWQTHQEVPASTALSDRISKELKRRGLRFFGTTICYAHMQAVGMVNDHLLKCFRHAACRRLA